jgi:hypothetical protein
MTHQTPFHKSREHDNDRRFLFKHHPPKVLHRSLQRPLRSDELTLTVVTLNKLSASNKIKINQ